MPLFDVIDLFLDEIPRGAPEQMALDEALLECAKRPLLRVYRWPGPAITFGYSQSLAAVGQRFVCHPCARRWTGGGVVEHGHDWTFSLIVPDGEPLARMRPRDTYRAIHGRVVILLNELGNAVRLVEPGENKEGLACFSSAALHDVIGLDQRKLCGGAQRRTRKGFLHQGSIQHLCLPSDFAVRLLSLLAGRTFAFSPCAAMLSRANELVTEKYSTMKWLERIA
jgi:lipoate-protein ligase A